MAGEALVRLESVSREYGNGAATVRALADVTLTLPGSRLCVVHGRSGSGKTTLLNVIGALDGPTAGRVEVGGRDISSLSEEELVEYRREAVGFVFQSFGLIPILTAAENVEIPLRLRRLEPPARTERALELLALVDLADRADHRPEELSGGEQQRVAIARALANEPSLVIADEPTAQLDSNRARTIMTVFRRLVDEEKVSVVVATHDPLLIGMGDHVVQLRDGTVVSGSA